MIHFKNVLKKSSVRTKKLSTTKKQTDRNPKQKHLIHLTLIKIKIYVEYEKITFIPRYLFRKCIDTKQQRWKKHIPIVITCKKRKEKRRNNEKSKNKGSINTYNKERTMKRENAIKGEKEE